MVVSVSSYSHLNMSMVNSRSSDDSVGDGDGTVDISSGSCVSTATVGGGVQRKINSSGIYI